ncbi:MULTISPECIES: hypothetical protein [unclassified Paenibacillus]|uniref:hypothetical protein n=1 Tax=unclassified Paenibacillus TaxID=185978 RepID=UPI00040C41C0|nr:MULTISPECIES: hypothetical protein [unclassified Paenibacillus]KGP81836.1 hypothetical protein P364_0115920 [Paenibacillus sp. MAEPY2]KGP86621.1 hypothetical protein P363_0116240 [Paenibacillus sp. MAEPY1]
MLKKMPNQYKNNPAGQQKWLTERMSEIMGHFNSLNPDDAMIHWDSVKVEYLKGGNSGPMIDIKKLIDIIDTQMATGLKTLLTLLSRHQGSTETYSSVDTDDEEESDHPGTDWLGLWALCISNGISDTEWPNMSIPKIRALMNEKQRSREFEIVLHGGKVENKKPKKAKYLSDLGFIQP